MVGEGGNVGFKVCMEARSRSSTHNSAIKERPLVSKHGAEQRLKLEEAWTGKAHRRSRPLIDMGPITPKAQPRVWNGGGGAT